LVHRLDAVPVDHLLGADGAHRLPTAGGDQAQQGQQHRSAAGDGGPMPPHEFAQQIDGVWRPRQHRFIGQVALEIEGQPVGRVIAARPVLLQCLHHDRVQIAAQ
jgi:hypothetical protein